jgi:tetratricopeptide (TPR) repeat protein
MRMWLWLVALVVVGTAVSAHAQSDDERARTHFEAGSSYYDQARYADAAREFQASYNLSPHPELLLNISQAEERALDYDAAIAAAERYLATNPKAQDKKTVEDRIASLRELKARYEQSGPEPLPPPGSEATSAAPPGTAPPPAAAPPPPTAAALGTAAAVPPPSAAAAPPQSGDRFTVPAIVLMGTGGAALVASLVTGLVAHADYKSLVRQCNNHNCPPSAEDELDEGKTLSVLSTVLTVVGVLAAGTGATLLVLDAQNDDAPPAPRPGELSLGPGPTPASLRATLTF